MSWRDTGHGLQRYGYTTLWGRATPWGLPHQFFAEVCDCIFEKVVQGEEGRGVTAARDGLPCGGGVGKGGEKRRKGVTPL